MDDKRYPSRPAPVVRPGNGPPRPAGAARTAPGPATRVQESTPAYVPEVRIPIKIAAIGAPNTTQEFTVDILEDFIGET
ncbi:MAG TPA: hypothetical protein VF276_16275, partial [Chloroflexia bacterium]